MGAYYILYHFVYLKFHNKNKITNQEISLSHEWKGKLSEIC